MMLEQVKLCCYLWYLGVKESLQVKRCIVLLALDEENLLWLKIWDCIKLHGGIFLGSLAWWQYVVAPCTAWTLGVTLAPVAGAEAAGAVQAALGHVSQVFWMAPAYAVTLLVSCSWYNDVAQRAVEVRNRHNARLRAEAEALHAAGSRAPAPLPHQYSGGSGPVPPSGAPVSPYEGAAQELYRVTLFAVFYIEVWVASLLPVIGPSISLLFSCWLYAYYCYDYQWTLRGMKLQDRLALFEGCAPFFAGYGLLLAAVTAALPFYMGAALMSLLFPAFVLVACDSHVTHVILEAVGHVGQAAPANQDHKASGEAVAARVRFRVPVFWMAAWPTQALLNAIFAGRRRTSNLGPSNTSGGVADRKIM